MKVICDIECNGLVNPDKIWVIVMKDIDTGEIHIFREVSTNAEEREKFLSTAARVTHWIGHSWLDYDYPNLSRLIGLHISDVANRSTDTLICSRLIDYSREQGHSVEAYGLEFNLHKSKLTDFSKYSIELEEYCVRDVEITYRIYLKYLKYITNPLRLPSILMEQEFQLIVNDLHSNGFSFNVKKAEKLLKSVTDELELLDQSILKEFPPRLKLIREVTPRATKYGTISLSSIPKVLRDQTHTMSIDSPFSWCSWQEFNPSSHKQLVDVLASAGWKPIDKTKTHIETERELNRLKYTRKTSSEVDLRVEELYNKIIELGKYGYKINENNLDTLPSSAPSPARSLAKRILYESRRRTLTEWLGLVHPDTGRIHGRFYGIGAWTHRMAHQNPNTANIPNEFDLAGNKKLLGKEMRSLWQAPKNRLLVGVDAEGIQLRIFAHYIDDAEFTRSLVEGKKNDKSDPHSLNARILAPVCKSRAAAKRFIFALLLGAGIGKLGEILSASEDETKSALGRLIERYQGFAYLKENIIPADAKRGWFLGLDGRAVRIPGETAGQRRHLCMSGYLQNGEAVVMKMATLEFYKRLDKDHKLVDMVHDEWQTEVPNNMGIALQVAKIQADSLRIVGERLGLRCPLAGSYYSDDIKDYTIGTNWAVTH